MTDHTAEELVKHLKERADRLGFSAFGITHPERVNSLEPRLKDYLQNGYHAGMDWMAETADRRANPKTLWPDVKSIIMLGMNYGPDSNPLDDLVQTDRGNISVYARHHDYHELIKGRLKELAGLLARKGGAEVKVFVDTAPVMEKPLAEAAGLGWQGKHSALVSRDYGSWLFLGAIFTSLDLPADDEHEELCGSCTKCLDICPTDAFPEPFKLDARKCLAYYSNEHHGLIPSAFRKPMGNRIFGCDDCLAVCPWNKFAHQASEANLIARDELKLPALTDLLRLDEPGFKQLTHRTPLRRLGYARFMRNVLIAAGNSGLKSLAGDIRHFLSHTDPTVRGTAVWAIRELVNENEFMRLAQKALDTETDSGVLSEWGNVDNIGA